MCGRYFIDPDMTDELIHEAIEILQRRSGAPVKVGEMFPGDQAPVLAHARTGRTAPFLMRWGYSTLRSKAIINARSETADTSPLFADGMKNRRCLIPATCYFEWEKRDKERIKHTITPAHGNMFYLAGIYRFEMEKPVFAVLTREAASGISHIHPRMPVIFPADCGHDWLDTADPAGVLSAALTDMAYD